MTVNYLLRRVRAAAVLLILFDYLSPNVGIQVAHAQAGPNCPVGAFSAQVASQTAYQFSAQDICRTDVFTTSSTTTVTLPYPSLLGGPSFWTRVYFTNAGGTITALAPPLSPTATPTVNGALTNLSISSGHSATIWFGSDGNWYVTYQGG